MAHNILIVDDEQAVRNVLRRKLERSGYGVFEAENGAEAMRAAETIAFDLVVTDILMPERDGIETICFLRKEQPRVKIIAISAPSNQLFLEDARGLGANFVFEKPINLEALAEKVGELLGE